ncbi:hypothetical protein LIA77_07115 [Sarocladium implicatum]|nr:hypothetical protein LIA77_07115 [Sarocladium implicatum]
MCLKPCVVSKITGEVDRCAKLASHYRSGNQTLKTIVIHGQSRIHAPVANRGIQARRSRESARRCRTSDNFLGDLPIIIGTSKGTSIRSIEVAEVGPLSPKQADLPLLGTDGQFVSLATRFPHPDTAYDSSPGPNPILSSDLLAARLSHSRELSHLGRSPKYCDSDVIISARKREARLVADVWSRLRPMSEAGDEPRLNSRTVQGCTGTAHTYSPCSHN